LLHRYNFYFSVKRFIAVNFYGKTSFNASSPLLFKRNLSLNASAPLLFKVTLPSSACGKGAGDSQHGIGVEGSSHLCSMGYYSN
jgi:hypothetical protein